MATLNLTESNITHRQQVVQLLRMSIDRQWRFSYVTRVKNSVQSSEIALTSVNLQEGVFSVDRPIERTVKNWEEPVLFRGQSGGISVIFQARVDTNERRPWPDKPSQHHRLELPYEIRCTQLRKSVRLNVEGFADAVPVTLYLALGVQMDATLVDISTTGAQFEVEEDQSARFKNLQILEACRISLPAGPVLRTGAQLLGVQSSQNRGVTYLRCQLHELTGAEEEALDQYIMKALEDLDPSLPILGAGA